VQIHDLAVVSNWQALEPGRADFLHFINTGPFLTFVRQACGAQKGLFLQEVGLLSFTVEDRDYLLSSQSLHGVGAGSRWRHLFHQFGWTLQWMLRLFD